MKLFTPHRVELIRRRQKGGDIITTELMPFSSFIVSIAD
jgi:hypothetical protein